LPNYVSHGKSFDHEPEFSPDGRSILRSSCAGSRAGSRNGSPGQSLRDRIGNTPLLRFDRLTTHLPASHFWARPNVQPRFRERWAAANIVAQGRRDGKFAPGKILLDATSGNTGIAYAMLGAPRDFP